MAADPHLDTGHRYELPTEPDANEEQWEFRRSWLTRKNHPGGKKKKTQKNAEEKQIGVIANRFLFCFSAAVFFVLIRQITAC